ncbi:MAG: mobile mystery protein B [Bacteroidetes bacterium]|nr:mobile mystery protein B [Bacteroidota bacterium]
MGLNLEYIGGQTPLDDEERKGLLIPSITTREELDEFEQQNIEKAIEWTLNRKFSKENIISEDFVRELHKKMFGDVWRWAGEFRKSEKNLGADWFQIETMLRQLNDDCYFWIENKTYQEEELSIRYKHRIVRIHCFANGNGRHSRLMGDVLINHIFGKPVFTWSHANITKKGETRSNYLNAIRAADNGDINPLIEFAKS